VAAAKNKKRKGGAGWSWRLAGLALCLFFALGVVTGLSRAGRIFALRLEAILALWSHQAHSAPIPTGYSNESMIPVSFRAGAADTPIALAERTDGFYALDSAGLLRGPVAPAMQGDLPILSGAWVENARGRQLLDHAATLIRSEAELSEVVSEMKVDTDGVAILFLDRPRIQLALALDDIPRELARAAQVLRLWQGHQQLIALLDLTASGQAVVRLKPAAQESARRAEGVRKIALNAPASRDAIRPRRWR
jgi:hypothetical protein